MRVKSVNLTNFRNYAQASVSLTPGKNILIGENAQGKSNFLEAIELLSFGASSRSSHDSELIRWNEPRMAVEVVFEAVSARDQSALRERVRLPIRTQQRGHEQGSAGKTPRVAD